MNLNHVLKKVGRRSSDDLFKISYFLNLHALGHPKSVTIFFTRELSSKGLLFTLLLLLFLFFLLLG
jgi:hypothetical protein